MTNFRPRRTNGTVYQTVVKPHWGSFFHVCVSVSTLRACVTPSYIVNPRAPRELHARRGCASVSGSSTGNIPKNRARLFPFSESSRPPSWNARKKDGLGAEKMGMRLGRHQRQACGPVNGIYGARDCEPLVKPASASERRPEARILD